MEVRRHLTISRKKLAHVFGVSYNTVNRWENGKTVPSKLAQATFDNFCARMAKQGKFKHEQD